MGLEFWVIIALLLFLVFEKILNYYKTLKLLDRIMSRDYSDYVHANNEIELKAKGSMTQKDSIDL